MVRLRPYKRCDSKIIEKWIQDKDVFMRWGGERFGEFPISAEIIDKKYSLNNGDCAEEETFIRGLLWMMRTVLSVTSS